MMPAVAPRDPAGPDQLASLKQQIAKLPAAPGEELKVKITYTDYRIPSEPQQRTFVGWIRRVDRDKVLVRRDPDPKLKDNPAIANFQISQGKTTVDGSSPVGNFTVTLDAPAAAKAPAMDPAAISDVSVTKMFNGALVLRYGAKHLPGSERTSVELRDNITALEINQDDLKSPYMMKLEGKAERVPVIRLTIVQKNGRRVPGHLQLNDRGQVIAGSLTDHDVRAEPGSTRKGVAFQPTTSLNPLRLVRVQPATNEPPLPKLPPSAAAVNLPPAAFIRFGSGRDDYFPLFPPENGTLTEPKNPQTRQAKADELKELLTPAEKALLAKSSDEKSWLTHHGARSTIIELDVEVTTIGKGKETKKLLVRYDLEGNPAAIKWDGKVYTIDEARKLYTDSKKRDIPPGFVLADQQNNPTAVAAAREALVQAAWRYGAPEVAKQLLKLAERTDTDYTKAGASYTSVVIAPTFPSGGKDYPLLFRGVGPGPVTSTGSDSTYKQGRLGQSPAAKLPDALKDPVTYLPVARAKLGAKEEDWPAAHAANAKLFPPVRVETGEGKEKRVGFAFMRVQRENWEGGARPTLHYVDRHGLPSFVAEVYDTMAARSSGRGDVALSADAQKAFLAALDKNRYFLPGSKKFADGPFKGKSDQEAFDEKKAMFKKAVAIIATYDYNGDIVFTPVTETGEGPNKKREVHSSHGLAFSVGHHDFKIRNLNYFGSTEGPLFATSEAGNDYVIRLSDEGRRIMGIPALTAKAMRLPTGEVVIVPIEKDKEGKFTPNAANGKVFDRAAVDKWTKTKSPFEDEKKAPIEAKLFEPPTYTYNYAFEKGWLSFPHGTIVNGGVQFDGPK